MIQNNNQESVLILLEWTQFVCTLKNATHPHNLSPTDPSLANWVRAHEDKKKEGWLKEDIPAERNEKDGGRRGKKKQNLPLPPPPPSLYFLKQKAPN